MKLSVSLPDDDVAFLEEYAREHACPSRSTVVHWAIEALRLGELRGAYCEAWAEWDASGEASGWEAVAGDCV
jgi:Arc/MetJ-type ribon-helix-helix transcriptional regulator